MLARSWIKEWKPNDLTFWETKGKGIARRNLIFSIFAEFLGFSVWNVWTSVIVALALPLAHFDFKLHESPPQIAAQLFLLTALPNLVGATLRIPYGAAVSLFGGRNWTVVSAALLGIPTVFLAVVLSNPHSPFWLLCLVAATAGLGGGNFASSMANISHFYPDRSKGWALGLNAAGGNIGVAVVQFVVPAAVGLGFLALSAKKAHSLVLPMAGLAWIPLIVVATLCAFFLMDNLVVSRATLRQQATILRRRHTWVMSFLYVGTFGSFLGYSGAFGLLIATLYPKESALRYAFLGPLVGSLARPLGGWMSDRIGGTVVTFVNFVLMGLLTMGLILAVRAGVAFSTFLALFLLLFVTTGIGNGSTYRMIPPLYLREALAHAVGRGREAMAAAEALGRKQAAAAIAFISAIGAYGGFLIPWAFKTTFTPPLKLARSQVVPFQVHAAEVAFTWFLVFYVLCTVTTWAFYLRTKHETAGSLSLAPARAEVAG